MRRIALALALGIAAAVLVGRLATRRPERAPVEAIGEASRARLDEVVRRGGAGEATP